MLKRVSFSAPEGGRAFHSILIVMLIAVPDSPGTDSAISF
jgi:hypothetical protein